MDDLGFCTYTLNCAFDLDLEFIRLDKESHPFSCLVFLLHNKQYVNPNYQGYEYDEYFGDEPMSQLDCHSPDTEWQLLGVYRQEFYQYIEQISKHLWAIDEYEYVVALAGLAYMTDDECFAVGYDDDGSGLYASVAPQPYGKFAMGIYKDEYCIQLDDSGVSFDDFGLQNEIDLGSKDATDDDGKAWAYDWWYDTQEASLTQLNQVYDTFRYCTSCVDYPTYQDGYFIGDYGTDDDDLINQCWKFWSHDSYTCEADCLAQADSQGSILAVNYGGKTFGGYPSGFFDGSGASSSSAKVKAPESSLSRLLANAFLTLSFLLFVATFLAFAVARRSRYRESRSSRSRRLLDDDRSRRSRRKSRTRGDDGDGLFKEKSHGGQSRSRSKRSSSRSSRRSRSRTSKSYEAPSRKSVAADDDY